MKRMINYVKEKYSFSTDFINQKFETIPEPVNYNFGVRSTVVPRIYTEKFPDLFLELQKRFNNIKVF